MAALAIVRKSARLAAGVVSRVMGLDLAHALHERKLSFLRHCVEVLHHKEKVSVWAVGIFSTGECALVLHACCSWRWRSVGGNLCIAGRSVVPLRRTESSSPLNGGRGRRRGLCRGVASCRGRAKRKASCRGGDPLWLWRSDRRGLGRRGKENGDLRLDKGLALLPVAELGVEGLHSGAEVRPHYEGDVDRPLRTLGT